LLGFRARPCLLGRLRGDRAQIKIGPLEDEPTRLQTRNEEQVVDEP
jgi:hypothetical protein